MAKERKELKHAVEQAPVVTTGSVDPRVELQDTKNKLKETEAEVKRLNKALAEEIKACTQALFDRDYNGAKWRHFEMECNRLGANITHNELGTMQATLQVQGITGKFKFLK